MRPYWAVLKARFQMLLQYRVAAVAGLGTQVFWGLIRVMIFAAFFRSAVAGSQPMTMEEVVTYVWLGQAMLLLVLWRVEPEMADMVRTGNVAYELLRPMDLYGLWFARSLAARTAPTLLRCIPLFLLAFAFFDMQPPDSVASFCAWLLATSGAVILSATIGALLTITLLWTISGRGLQLLVTAGAWTFSGIVLPLPLFPDWAQPVLNVLPFRGLMDVPFRLYLGHLPPTAVLGLLAHQATWVLLLTAFGRWLLARGTRRLVVQGG